MSRRLVSCALALELIGWSAGSARADQATAAAAFNRAEELSKQGKWSEACPFYETSYNADPQLGVLLHLADCNEKVGRTATAWAQFSDAVEIARKRGDTRERLARSRADSLLPKLSKLNLKPPPKLFPGMVVRRDGVDITVLVGTEMPIDPGDHVITANAPGFVEWTTTVTITGTAVKAVDIPALEKEPEKPVEAPDQTPQEGTLVIVTQPGAKILIDGAEVGVGRYEGKLPRGGHTLRVTAAGMRPYQSEVLVESNRERTIDVPLEPIPAVVERAPVEKLPDYEAGLSFGMGAKLREDDPTVRNVRAEFGFRLGRRINLGAFAEYGELNRSNACGFSMPGVMPSTPFDFGQRNQFTKCAYFMPGIQLLVHMLPGRRFDPYLGISPGFRIGLTSWTPYIDGMAQKPESEMFPGIVAGARAGVNYRPKADLQQWVIGLYVESQITLFGQEASSAIEEEGETFLSVIGGLRSTWAF
ncbi:MAG: PEGA domain-containing protein [Kofleriaceae bacterium]